MAGMTQSMKFNPDTKALSTHDGKLIKILSCHLNMQLKQLHVEPDGHRRCDMCEHKVLDTALLSEGQIREQVEMNPRTCLIVRRGQENVEIV